MAPLTTPPTSDVSGITTFKDTAQVVENKSAMNLFLERPWSKTYKSFVPLDFLKRSYQIASFTWAPGLSAQKIPLIGALSTNTVATAVFKQYRLARCTFKVHIKMTSNQYQQGTLVASWMPCVSTSIPTDEQSVTCYQDSTVLSACSQDNVTFHIGYFSPEDWFDTTAFTSTSAEHATVIIAEQATLVTTSTTVSANVYVEVYGSIETCDLSGAISQMKAKMSKAERDAEAKAKARESKDAQVGAVIRNVSQMARTVPVIGEIWSPIADVINTVFGTELSKPVNNSAPTSVYQSYYNDATQVDGLTEASYLSLYQNPRIAVGPSLFGMESTFMSLRKFAGTPMLHQSVLFDWTTTSSYSEYVRPDVIGSDQPNPDFLAMAMRMAKYWRGSIKYLFHFIMPAFYSSRFEIRLQFAASVSNAGDMPRMLFDVKGDTKIKITVPYLNFRAWSDKHFAAGTRDLDPIIVITQQTPIVGSPSPTTAVIYCEIYRAGGEDMAFAVLDDPASPAKLYKGKRSHVDLGMAKAQMNIKKEFAEQFPPLANGEFFSEECHAVMSERIENLSDLLKRPTTGYTAATAFGNTSATTAHKIIMNSFMWQRGGLIYRHMHLGNTTTHNDGWYLTASASTTNKLEQGWAPAYNTATPLWQQEAVVVPYYCATPYVVTFGATSNVLATSKKASPVGSL